MLVVRMNFDKMLKLQLSYYLTLYCIYSFIVEEDCKFSHAKIVQHRRGDVSSVGRKFRDSGFVKDRNNELAESTSFEKVLIKDERKKTREISVSNKAYVESTSRLNQNASTIIDEALGNNISKLNHSHQFRNAQLNSSSAQQLKAGQIDCHTFSKKNKVKSKGIDEFCYNPSDSLKCYQDPIFCETFHLSGKRELKWPAYGEYSYLPQKHWVKVLQHGGIAFLYHPCAENSSISRLRYVADSCMHRYVLTQYHKLSPERPLALVSWGCFLLMNNVNVNKSKDWIKSHAYKGPASHIHRNGTYEHKLLRPSKVITDIKDTLLCPDEKEKASLLSTRIASTSKVPTVIAKQKHVGEEIILKRLEKAKHNAITHSIQQTLIPVDTKKSLAAFGSLVFLSVLLFVLLFYTKLWRPKVPSRRSAYIKLGDLDAESEESYYESNFSLLKTGQDFISSLKRSRRDKKNDSYSRVKLLAPISEDECELEDL